MTSRRSYCLLHTVGEYTMQQDEQINSTPSDEVDNNTPYSEQHPMAMSGINSKYSQQELGFSEDEKMLMVYKRNELILGKYSLSTSSHKLFSAILTKVHPYQDGIPSMNLKKSDLGRLLGISRQAVQQSFVKMAKELADLKVGMDMSKKTWAEQQETENLEAAKEGRPARQIAQPSEESWEMIPIFYKIANNDADNSLLIQFHPDAKPFLSNLRGHFTYYHYLEIRDVKSQYGIRFYEICRFILPLTAVSKGRTVAQHTFTLDELKKILEVTAKTYDVFNKFESKIIKVSQKSMQDTDLAFDYKVHRRKEIDKPHAITIIARINNPNLIRGLADPDDLGEWQAMLATFTKKQQEDIQFFSEERKKRNVNYYLRKAKTDDIKKPKPWIIKAIKQDYAGIEKLRFFDTVDRYARNFIDDILIKDWVGPSYSEEDRDEAVRGTFNTENLRSRFEKYKEANMSDDEWKKDKQQRRRAMSEQILADSGLLDGLDDWDQPSYDIKDVEGEVIEGELCS